ncbi:hypothetical protein [Streptomyces catenulae]|uniref:Uncharacterized protein n=1 Tax=Streptomyces catenulae TaxID=66875 RepID=A0ABV2YZ14_9ACTN|nr:hypothetical protein [Streptomyces catenulae]
MNGNTDAPSGRPFPPLGTPLRRQHRPWGLLLRLLGSALNVVAVLGFLTAVTQLGRARFPEDLLGTPGWQRVLIAAVAFLASTGATVAGPRLRRHGRRHCARVLRTVDEARGEPYVLYLRPFTVDRPAASLPPPAARPHFVNRSGEQLTTEENLTRMFRAFGRVIAVGRPEERLPQPGAARLYLPWDDWQPVVTALIDDARIVVLGTGVAEGTLWELEQLIRRRAPHHVLLLVYSDEREYAAFRVRGDAILARVLGGAEGARTGDGGAGAVTADAGAASATGAPGPPPVFPGYPPLRRPEQGGAPLVRGVIHFGPGWTPHFTRIDPTTFDGRRKQRVKEAVRAQWLPAYRHVLDGVRAEEEAADRRDATGCPTLADLEEVLRTAERAGAADATTGTGDAGTRSGEADAPADSAPSGPEGTLFRVEFTPGARIRGVSPAGPNEPALDPHGRLVSVAGAVRTPGQERPEGPESAGEGPVALDIPYEWLCARLREVRGRGAADSDTVRLDLGPTGRLHGLVGAPPSAAPAPPGPEISAEP